MPKRSKVELYEQIRKARQREEGVSIRELARRFGVHRRDVRQALSSALPPPRKTAARPAPVLGPWKALIDGWLEADRSAPRKQRHTARRVWQRLVEEHGVDVAESTVRRYVAEVRRRQELPLVEVAVPQHHPLGEEAEVDFGTVSVYLGGLLTEVSLFLLRLSASGRTYPHAYLNEAQEVFLDGHVRAFDHLGGVPGRIRYDNLKAAVARVLRGRNRIEAERFMALRSHYGFDSFFCLPGPGGAHEKAGVEGEVGRFRRRHLVPVPHVSSMGELNALLLAAAARDDRRYIAHRGTSSNRAWPATPNKSDTATRTPSLARTACTCALSPLRSAHELGPVADELTQLPYLGRCHPGLGQAPEAQQVDQVGGVPLIVLDPAVPPVVAEGMGQVHSGAFSGQHVGCPVPPVVASSTTSGSAPALATSRARATRSLSMRTVSKVSPSALLRTMSRTARGSRACTSPSTARVSPARALRMRDVHPPRIGACAAGRGDGQRHRSSVLAPAAQ